jgi:hypothetical protein
MKPLIRWTLGGNVHDLGIDCLKLSIKSFKKIYGNIFDYLLCYNNLNEKHLKIISNFDIQLYEQFHCEELEYKPTGCAWKLYPPRLAFKSHEIFIDNDLIVYKRLKTIDDFLDNKIETFGLQGYGMYGKYEKYVPENKHINVGLFGICPNFDLAALIKLYQENDLNRNWENYFDDQGIIAACLLNHSECSIINFEEINNCHHQFKFAKCGSHFCHLNQGNTSPFINFKKYQKI